MNAHSRTHGVDHSRAEGFFGLGAKCEAKPKSFSANGQLCRPYGPFFVRPAARTSAHERARDRARAAARRTPCRHWHA
eukprot:3282306-Prymnesium_polylepis.1